MQTAQIYATANQVIGDMNQEENGNFAELMDRIREASKAIEGKFGSFIPVIETRTFMIDCYLRWMEPFGISPLLNVSAVSVNGISVSDYSLTPENRHWINGPFSMIQFNQDLFPGDVLMITGSWGMYDNMFDLGLTGTQADATVKTLSVANGGLLSAGMIVQIENEQELITAGNGSKGSPVPVKTNSLLNGTLEDVNAFQLILVDNGSEFFEGEVLRIDSEDLFIDRIAGNQITVKRAWNQTLISAHADNSEIYVYRSYAVMRGVNGTSAAAHTNSELMQRLIPEDLNWLCRQITGLMIRKARSGFQGRAGSAETGESMYFSEFPPNQINFIQGNYRL